MYIGTDILSSYIHSGRFWIFLKSLEIFFDNYNNKQ